MKKLLFVSLLSAPGNKRPTRWITVTPSKDQRLCASATIAAMDFSVIPG